MTHQEIIDRREAIAKERARLIEARETKFDAELQSLKDKCAGLGHIYTATTAFLPNPNGIRRCAICGTREPA